jgi:guanylate kinase
MLILVAPSGAGKSTLLERILAEKDELVDVITFTTREKREGEKEGNPYHFVTPERFFELRDQGFFVEWARVHSNFYGTPIDQIERAWGLGKTVIMDLDIQGADACKARFPQARTIFVLPPSLDELRRRVLSRSLTPPPDLDLRMENAKREMARSQDCDFQLLNGDLELAYLDFKKYIEEFLKQG